MRKMPLIYSFIVARMENEKCEVDAKTFIKHLNKVRIRKEMWFEIMKELIEMGLVKGYEDKKRVIVLHKSLSKQEKKRLVNMLPLEFTNGD